MAIIVRKKLADICAVFEFSNDPGEGWPLVVQLALQHSLLPAWIV